MGLTQEENAKLAEEAALWVQRLRERDTPALHAEFSAWVSQGTKHLEEFLFAQALWKEMDHVDRDMRDRLWPAGDDELIVEFPKLHSPKVVTSRAENRRLRRPLLATAAAATLAVITWALVSNLGLGSPSYATAIGEQKTVKLADGSLVYLNTASRVVVDLTETQRLIHLTAGEALFTVAHDSSRPFVVTTDTAHIRAVGTQFNVYRASSSATRVTVVEGVVQVSSTSASRNPMEGESSGASGSAGETPRALRLAAGSGAEIDDELIVPAEHPSVEQAISWRQRKLIFPGNEVREIVAQFNRYSHQPIRIEGPELERRRMSGVFDADDPTPLLEYFSRDPGIDVLRREDEILIRQKAR